MSSTKVPSALVAFPLDGPVKTDHGPEQFPRSEATLSGLNPFSAQGCCDKTRQRIGKQADEAENA